MRGDRFARYQAFAAHVLTAEGREEFLQRVEEAGSIEEAARVLDLPEKKVMALVAMYRELSEGAGAVLKLKTHELRAETLEIADGSGEPKLMIEARKDLSEVWNREDYGQRLKVEKSVRLEVDAGLLGAAERLLGVVMPRVGLAQRLERVVEGPQEPVPVTRKQAVI
jgi:hypothetical protein